MLLFPTNVTISINTPSQFRSRSRRGLFDFVGDLASGLFGVATQGEINALKAHINKIYRYESKLERGQEAQLQLMHSYVQKTNEKVQQLFQSVNDNHKYITDLSTYFQQRMGSLSKLELEIARALISLLHKSRYLSDLERQLDLFLQGIHHLVQRRLSPLLVPEQMLKRAVSHIENTLRRRHPDFHVINHHPAYYYQQQSVMYSYHTHKFYVTIQVPISSRTALFDLLQIITMPVPLNHSTTHATQLANVPNYLAITTDRTSFMEMSVTDMQNCVGNPIKTCPLMQGQRSTDTPTCATALFLQTDETQLCQYRLKEHAVTPSLLEVKSGLALLSNITEVILTCRNQVYKKPGCMFCLFKIPCECALMADIFQIPPRLTACDDGQDSDDTIIYPVNVALLQQFFNSTTLSTLLSSPVFTKPVQYALPQLQIDEHNFQTDLEKASKLDAELGSISNKMKKNEKVYRQMSSYSLDDFPLDDDFDYTSPTNLLACIALLLSALLLVCVLILYKRVRTLCLVISVLTAGKPIVPATAQATSPQPPLRWNPAPTGQSNPSDRPPQSDLVYTNMNPNSPNNPSHESPPTSPLPLCEPPVADHLLLTIELFSLMLLLIFVTRSAGLLLKTSVYRTVAVLEISDGQSFTDLPLLTLTYCPTEYYLIMKSWVRSLSLLKHTYTTDDLEITWTSFHIIAKLTKESLSLPKVLKLSLWQNYKMKKIIQKGDYVVNLKLVHGGRVMYMRKAKPGQFEKEVGVTAQHQNDFPTIYGPKHIQDSKFKNGPSAPPLYPSPHHQDSLNGVE
ncbi:uncharacterized protein [Littorina saxatilis]|uniref:uncharacterized protein n=1 Tax=Littorina saxatilis TaxID=31220 RepID=UPI0038B44EE1